MSDLKSKLDFIKSKESFLEKIKRIIPGYDGYVNRDNSRELDTQLRNQLALKLEQNRSKIRETVSNYSKNGRLFQASDMEKIEKKNDTAIAKFRSAARGYSGAFDVVKIKDEKLEQIYNFDVSLLGSVEEISAMFDNLLSLSGANQETKDAEDKVSNALSALINKFDEREAALRAL
ncbi:MAG: hypothetical protein HY959_06700 [Ignavibacteriae bacterium]|nr:hypothetical protein [Ignavibacteriota bacterium]